MKFSLFAHLERITPEQTHNEMYEEFLSLSEMADQAGMETVWTGEHHGMDFTIAPNPFISLVDLAHRTKNVRLGTSTIVAPFWHPIKLAGEAAMTDIICRGRLDIGVARGAYSFEYERLRPGMDAAEAGRRMREVVMAVRELWAGDYEHDGEFFTFPKTSSSPKPLQHEGPPVWIAARDPASHEFAVENDCNVQVTPLSQNVDEVRALASRFDDACRKFNKRPRIMILQHTYVGETDDDLASAAISLSRFYNHFGAWFLNAREISQGQIAPLSDEEIAANDMYSPAVMKENLVVGKPQAVIDRLKLYQDLGYDQFSYWVDSGMTMQQKKASLTRFIEQVMPAFD